MQYSTSTDLKNGQKSIQLMQSFPDFQSLQKSESNASHNAIQQAPSKQRGTSSSQQFSNSNTPSLY